MKNKNIPVFIEGAVVLTFLYIVLSESFSLGSLAIGAFLGIGSMLICVLFFPNSFLSRYKVRILPLLWYFAVLIFIVVESGIKSLVLGFSDNSVSQLVVYESSLKSDMLVTLLANSVTLTPGTTTVDKTENTLRIMMLCKKGCENDLSGISRLEKMIKKAERGA